MGTMLITRSTPRITYRIGMRAGLSGLEDESLPRLGLEAPSIEVAAEFTGMYGILMWNGRLAIGNREACHYQSFGAKGPLAGVWQEKARGPGLDSKGFALAAAGHQLIHRFARGFALMQNGLHLFGDGHLDTAGMRQPHRRRGGEDSLRNHAMHAG